MRIEVRDVWKRFGPTIALQSVQFEIAMGERVGLVGPNGSGKSTLLRALLGLVACEGDVLLDGVSPFDERMAVAHKLAYVPQVAPNWGAPVGEVIESVASLRNIEPARIVGVAKKLGLEPQAVIDRPFRNLSGGMKQKLLISVALATDATLFILDEPTASLDGETREQFFSVLEEVAPAATRVFCSHRRDEFVDQVDRVIALSDGKVVFDGATSAWLEQQAPRTPKGGGSRPHLAIIKSDDPSGPGPSTPTLRTGRKGG